MMVEILGGLNGDEIVRQNKTNSIETIVDICAGHLLKLSIRGRGPVAQRITRLTTDQEIPGSNPGWLVVVFYSILGFFQTENC